MKQVADQATIATLNAEARVIPGDTYDSSFGTDALGAVARRHDMEIVAVSDSCTVYQMQDGRLVNCWTEGVQSSLIEDGGIGFDDQTDWMDESTD